MSENIRYPNITASTPMEQLVQIKSYLHQLVEQLNYALSTIGGGSGATQTASSYEVQGGELSYYELRTLIIQQLQEVYRLFDKLATETLLEYVKEDEIPQLVEDALKEVKGSGLGFKLDDGTILH
jgi:hypothetical protein